MKNKNLLGIEKTFFIDGDKSKGNILDLLIDDGKIAEIGSNLNLSKRFLNNIRIIDGREKILLPSFCDMHVHAREPGQEDKETIETVSKAAINGGISSVVLMPNTSPAVDNSAQVKLVLEKGKKTDIQVFTSSAITCNREGKKMTALLDVIKAGAIILTDDGSPVSNPALLLKAMKYTQDQDILFSSHCETMELSGKGSMNEGEFSYQLGLPGHPVVGEEICIDRDCRLAKTTGARLHIQHVSSKLGLETIIRYKNQGARITSEVSPHHLIFCDADIENYDTNYKMNPPLRSKQDSLSLLDYLRQGLIDAIATDHAPHTRYEKEQPFDKAPFGITGLETAVVSLYHYFIRKGELNWEHIIKHYSSNPRKLIGLEPIEFKKEEKAEFVLFNPKRETHFTQDFMYSKSINTPFLNKKLKGMIEFVYGNGKILLDRVQA